MSESGSDPRQPKRIMRKHLKASRNLQPALLLSLLFIPLVGYLQILPFTSYQNTPDMEQRIELTCSFLKHRLYNPALRLVRETPSSNTYHIASDNFLAQKAPEQCDPDTSKAILESISTCCDEGHSLMHEALLGVGIPLPIHNQTIKKIANSTENQLFNNITAQQADGNYTVLWEVRNGSKTLSPYSYADIAAYTGLELYRQRNQTGAQSMLNILNTMYDGKGIVDEPCKNGTPSEHGIYQTYKLALHTTLQTKLSQGPFPGQVENLLRMQGPDGGFHTGYDQTGTYARTLANAETASITIIVLDKIATTRDGCLLFPLLCVPQLLGWIALYSLIAVVGGVAIIAAFVYWDRRRRTILTPIAEEDPSPSRS